MTNPHAAKWLYLFGEGASEGDPARKDLLGGKGASLAAMSRAGLAVPPGFTISAECGPLIERSGSWPPGLAEQVREAMGRLEAMTGRPFGRGPRPLLVAVRSGAAVSMPGMMDTILNCGLNPSLAEHASEPARFWRDYAAHIRMFARSVAGIPLQPADADDLLRRYEQQAGRPFPTDPWDALSQSIDAVFESWKSERAAAFRKHNDIRGVLGTAVNVQAMWPSERAGVLFTTNPNDVDAGEMVVEAAWGLGEAVVSGAVTPDVYVLDAKTLLVKRQTPGDRPGGGESPALTAEQLRELGGLGRKVEAHFDVPCDIEWGLADGKLALLQSRAIRGLDVRRDVEVARQAEIERLRELAGGERVVWAAHNLGETLPSPTPLTWDIVRHFMSGSGGFGLMYRDFGYRPSHQVRSEGFLELICGRLYVDPRRAAGLFWEGIPLEYDPEEIVRDPSVLGRVPRKLNPAKADAALFLRLPRLLWDTFRCSRRMRKARANVLASFESDALPRLRSFLDEASHRDLASLTVDELIGELDRRRRFVLDDFGRESLKPGLFAAVAQQALEAILGQLMGEQAGGDLARVLTTGLEGDTTLEQNILLFRVARGEATLDEFLAAYGHRAVNEMELAQPRWREDPAYLERMIESFRRPGVAAPGERHRRQADVRRQAEAELPARLAECGGSALLERILPDLKDAQRLLPYRERAKHHLMMGYETIRAVLVELARRWDLGRDLFFLRLDELGRFEADRGAFEKAIASRKLRWRSAQRISLSETIDSERLDELGRPPPPDEAAGLVGRPLASGAAEGVARVVLDPREAGDLGTAYILVCPSTDPGWTPLFVHARGLVVERGGVLSHGAIVARDFGIPAVACEGATQRVPDGARVRIDGASGEIRIEDA